MADPMQSGSSTTKTGSESGRYQHGFAYVLLLLAVATFGFVATSMLQLGVQAGRRDAEKALMSVGDEFERALYSYAGVPVPAFTGMQPGVLTARGPRTLEELLKDPRSPQVRRHLRQVYADPMTGQVQWGLVRDPAGFIVGVYSLAEGQPHKQMGFDQRHLHFEDSESYSKWVFGLPLAQVQALQKTPASFTPSLLQP